MVRLTVDVKAAMAVGDVPVPSRKWCLYSATPLIPTLIFRIPQLPSYFSTLKSNSVNSN